MVRVSVDLVGMETRLAAELLSLPGKLQKKALRSAARKAGKIYATAAKARAPVDTGQVRDSIKVRALKRSRGANASVGVTVGTGAKDYVGDQYYAAFIEYGHRVVLGGNVVGKVDPAPFMRPAFDASVSAMEQVYVKELKDQLESIRVKGV